MATCFAEAHGLCQLVMMSLLLLLPLLTTANAQVSVGVNGTRPKFDPCYGCICEAASRCNPKLGCNKGVCGLFQITKPYWEDAGSPVVPGDSPTAEGAFERCTTHTFCGLETVQLYMARYAKDCNKNGEVDCHDFALLHFLGPSCNGKPNTAYVEEFDNCRLDLLLLNQP